MTARTFKLPTSSAGDPQHTTGSVDGYPPKLPCRCQHPANVHEFRSGYGFTACSACSPAGHCLCVSYQPGDGGAS